MGLLGAFGSVASGNPRACNLICAGLAAKFSLGPSSSALPDFVNTLVRSITCEPVQSGLCLRQDADDDARNDDDDHDDDDCDVDADE